MIQTADWVTDWIETGWPLFQPFFALLIAILCERLVPIAPHWDPFILFRGMASNLENRVNPSHRPNSPQQQLISGSLSILLMLSLIMPITALLLLFADNNWPLDAAILYLCLQWQPIRRDIVTIQNNLSTASRSYAKQLLGFRLRRETTALSEMGLAKATIEMAALRYFYTYISILLSFMLLGPLAALMMRCLFELGQAWQDTPLQHNRYTLPLNQLRALLEWLPKRLWLGMLRLSSGWLVTGRYIQQQAGVARGRMSLLAATAVLSRRNLGGPVLYASKKIRYPRVEVGANPQPCDIIPAINHLERVGITLLIGAGLIYLTLSSIPLVLSL